MLQLALKTQSGTVRMQLCDATESLVRYLTDMCISYPYCRCRFTARNTTALQCKSHTLSVSVSYLSASASASASASPLIISEHQRRLNSNPSNFISDLYSMQNMRQVSQLPTKMIKVYECHVRSRKSWK